ncbi:MAG: class I SAM-dependent methyltransferase [Candidatus Aenigmarchaeota archaeon]|nr:class I SAM-dependent methyltransferase [Candidatus Aenigmarchaeota archaeon]
MECRHKLAFELIEKGKKVLDVGCGDGNFAKLLIEHKNCKVVGCDIDPKSVKQARKKGIKAVVCDIEKGKLPKGKFDYITCLDVLEHLKTPASFLQRIKDKTNFIIITVPNACWLKDRLSILFGKVSRHNAYKMGQHLWYWSYSQFESFIKENGFEIVDEKKIKKPNLPIFDNWFVYSYALKIKRR